MATDITQSETIVVKEEKIEELLWSCMLLPPNIATKWSSNDGIVYPLIVAITFMQM